MQYISTNKDGSVGVVTLFPTKAIINETGGEIKILGLRRRDPKDGQAGQCVIYGAFDDTGVEVVVGDENYNVADLKEDSVVGVTLVFPDMEKDIVRKWDRRADVVSWRQIERKDIPTDRYFRDAWEDKAGKIEIHMEKAREIRRAKLRIKRVPLLTQLDIDYQRADEEGNNGLKKEITAKKRALRDSPKHPGIDTATTPEELKLVAAELFV